jgi:para-nitrobenzyl esterase
MTASSSAQNVHPVIETPNGHVRGQRREGADAFLGIPYGADTGGAHRFLPPQPAPSWSGVLDAFTPGPQAPQPTNTFNFPPDLRAVYPDSTLPQSEQCLTLNVWTPAARDGTLRPVMVWLHGGAFISGTGWTPWTDGARLAAGQDVVVVSITHRLGLPGFLSLGEQADESHAASGLSGMLDIVAALRWVRENIAAFGGDPDCVTLFGQSGGGAKISALMAMPAAHGLFHRVIVQSGPALSFMTPEDAARTTHMVLDILGLAPTQIRRLLDLPIATLVAAQREVAARNAGQPFAMRRRIGFNPVVDGVHLPNQPFEPTAPALSARVPMLIGTNRDEMGLFSSHADWASPEASDALVNEAAPRVLGLSASEATRILQVYARALPALPAGQRLLAASGDRGIRIDSLKMADRHAAQGASVHVYLFTWPTPVLGGRLGASHSVELPFVFDRLAVSTLTGGTTDAQPLADLMSAAWAAFARHGSPQTAALPDWPRHNPVSRPTLCLNLPPERVLDPLGVQRQAWPHT